MRAMNDSVDSSSRPASVGGIDPRRPAVAAAAIAIAATLCVETIGHASCGAMLSASDWAAAPIVLAVDAPSAAVGDQPSSAVGPLHAIHEAVVPPQVTYQSTRLVSRMRWGGLYGP